MRWTQEPARRAGNKSRLRPRWARPGAKARGNKFRAYEKANGSVLWETELSAGVTGAPITYEYEGRHYIAVGGKDDPAEWVAFALGEATPSPRAGGSAVGFVLYDYAWRLVASLLAGCFTHLVGLLGRVR